MKFKTNNQVVNRGGKKYIAKDGIIEVEEKDIENFEGFEKVITKKTTNANNKKRN